ncbi:MAG: HWE histidine kinase domain-containing protein [Litorimonas sp.]
MTNASADDKLKVTEIDLTNCDREAIHTLGRVQSFGALLAVSPDWLVNHASVNLHNFVGVEAEEAIGAPISEILSAEALHDIRSKTQSLATTDSVERLFGIRLTSDEQLFDVAVHLSGRSFVIEIERHDASDRTDHMSYVKPMIERIGSATTSEQICDRAARQLRALSGFDRVMVYKFGEDGSGTVVAESINGQREAFKGLRYPASDIPNQARELYKRSLFRLISDVSDHGVEIIPAVNPEGRPLDLSLSVTRAVSPIHLEYLTNMGVGASMSISILKRGKLWGLFACHNDLPKTLSFTVRSAAELFGQLFAYLLDQREGDEERAAQDRAQLLHDQLMSQLAEGLSISDSLDVILSGVKNVIAYDGAIGWIDGKFTSVGHTPTREEFVSLAKFLNTTATGRIYHTKNLISAYPKAIDFSDRTAGILALPVSRSPRDFIVLCRREIASSITWAGNPDKPVTVGKNGRRLTPRKSFEAWREVVRHTSAPWFEGELRAAESLRITLLEVVLRMSDTLLKDRAHAQESQEILIAELNHRVRNILNLIKGLISQSKDDAISISEFTDIVGGRVQALARAHDQITKENWSPASVYELIETEAQAYLTAKSSRVTLTGPDALVTPPAFTTLSLVMHELMTNSMKYGALCDSRGSVVVEFKKLDDGSLEINWREKGGPPIQTPPTRKGFGTTIIERSIPFELKGEAKISYKMSGVEAAFIIPPAFVSNFQDADEKVDVRQPIDSEIVRLSGHVLIVEDNMIIAMDAEEIVGELGAERVTVASDVGAAISAISSTPFTFALLDVNLGAETSEPVAALLSEKGIPFAFATGYGDATAVTKAYEKAPVIQKPYEKSALANGLAKLKLLT